MIMMTLNNENILRKWKKENNEKCSFIAKWAQIVRIFQVLGGWLGLMLFPRIPRNKSEVVKIYILLVTTRSSVAKKLVQLCKEN